MYVKGACIANSILEILESKVLVSAVLLWYVLASKVLVPKELILKVPTVLVIGVLVLKLARPGMLKALVLSKVWEYNYNHLKS